MSVESLLLRLRQLAVKVSVDGDDIVVDAPDNVLTPELVAEIKAAKPKIVANLHRSASLQVPSSPPKVTRLTDRSRFPLSFSQQRLWYLDQLEPFQATYNLPFAYDVYGRLELSVLQSCINRIADRHEILRTTFLSEDGIPYQKVSSEQPIEIEQLAEPDDPGDESATDELLLEFAMRPFDLQEGPLVRAAVLPRGVDRSTLIIVPHHTVFDGASVSIFESELRSELEADSSDDAQKRNPLQIQFGDFSKWQEGWMDEETVRTYLRFWSSKLSPDLKSTELPLDFPRPANQTYVGARVERAISVEDVVELRRVAREMRTTGFVVLMSAFNATLHIMCAAEDVTVGYPIAARSSKDTEDLIGFFANTLPLRTLVTDEMSFADLVNDVRASVVESLDWSDLPFEKMVEGINPPRDLARAPIFQIFLSYLEGEALEFTVQGLRFERRRVPMPVSRFDVSMFISESVSGMNTVLEYNTDLLLESTAQRILDLFASILSQVIEDPTATLGELRTIPEGDLKLLRHDWNQTEDERQSLTVMDLIDSAMTEPAREAVVFAGESLTYGELASRSSRVAAYLLDCGVEPGDLVGIHMERSADMLVGMLGVMRAGAVYLPLDPGFPSDRLEYMLADSGTSVLLTQSSLAGSLAGFAGRSISMDGDAEAIAACSETSPEIVLGPDALAYVLYTSGSTGRPKGVMVPHSCVSNFLESMAAVPGLSADDTLLAVTTTSFDISVLELFLPLTVGARVVIASGEDATDSARLKSLLARSGANVMQATPTTWRMLLDAGWIGGPGFRAYCGGEPMPQDVARDLLPACGELWNMYGPTETTIWSSCARITDAAAPITIGQPIANTQMYVLDKAQNLQPIGVPGELCIGGAGVTRGYLNQPELTASVFIDDPYSDEAGALLYRTGDLARWRPDGSLQHLGRIDGQVKIRGFRIELGEIESVLMEHSSVKSAACNVWQVAADDQRLVAYIVTEDDQPVATTELRKHLRGKVPDYMVPQHFEKIAAIPLTANGKIDRKSLPEISAETNAYQFVEPQSDIEQRIAEIWSAIIGVDRVGRHDFFFEIGGHSLLAVRAAAQMEKKLGLRPDLRDLILEDLSQIASRYDQVDKRPSSNHEKKTRFIERLLGRSR